MTTEAIERRKALSEQSWSERWIDHYYRDRPGWVNGTAAFHALCRNSIPDGVEILEVGSGPSNPTSEFLGSHWPTHGLDPNPAGGQNRFLRSFHQLTGPRYPFADATFAAVVSDYVVEHVSTPADHLREVFRVLVPEGVYVLRTPNLWHYVSIVAASTPHWFHALVSNRLRNLSPETNDLHPTFYLLNTSRAVRQVSVAAGFRVRSIELAEKEPSYAVSSRAFFIAGLLYERVVNASTALENFRANIYAVLEKPAP